MNRRLVDPICRWCFAPTESAAENLRSEHVPSERIFVTGNTAIDALMMAVEKLKVSGFQGSKVSKGFWFLVSGSWFLVTRMAALKP